MVQLVLLGGGGSRLSLDDNVLYRFLDGFDRGLVEVGQQGIQLLYAESFGNRIGDIVDYQCSRHAVPVIAKHFLDLRNYHIRLRDYYRRLS